MKIEGIGNVNKKELMSVLTADGRKAVKSGEISMKEIGQMYKLEKTKQLSKVGRLGDTFSSNFRRVPEGLFEKLSPEEVAELVDAFYQAYSDGKNA